MRVVLDTNVWLDWLVFDDPGIAFLKQGFAERLFEIVIDEACEAEFERVLAYPLGKFPVDAPACMAQLRRIATRAGKFAPEEKMRLPRCSDPDDQKFLELALAARVDFLVTKDRALLDVERRWKKSVPGTEFRFRIVNLESFRVACNRTKDRGLTRV